MSQMKDKLKKYFKISIDNIVEYGDTDIFPFPIENHILYDCKDKVVDLLIDMYDNFESEITAHPPAHISTLSPVGYTGFRWATQLDPIWNAYLLGLVLYLWEEIEDYRIPISKESVFSYRLDISKKKHALFNKDIGWTEFMKTSLSKASTSKYVLICDISDCYQRISHHRLENALNQISQNSDLNNQILSIISNFSHPKSYGLPIGGPAARILCELVLNFTDHLLSSNHIKFCRFADDYHIFCDSMESAYKNLIFISEKLSRTDGLALQKSKTRIMQSEEFISNTNYILGENETSEQTAILKLSLRFDPYASNPDEEYNALKSEVKKHDIIGLLNMEIAKLRVHAAVTKKLIQAIRYLGKPAQDGAIRTIFENLETLFPIFPTIAITISSIFEDLEHETKDYIYSRISDEVKSGRHIFKVDLNSAYALRILSKCNHPDIEELLVTMHNGSTSPLIRRDIIYIMAHRRAFYWITDAINDFKTVSSWERRAYILASFFLKDAGSHWRQAASNSFTPFEVLTRDWVADKNPTSSGWKVPI